MKKIALYILFSLIFNLAFSQTVKEKDTLELWTMFSIGNFVNENAHRIVSEKWPFKTKSMTGDVIWKKLTDSIENHNKAIWKYLDHNGFENSEKKYQSEFNSERNRIQKAVDLSFNHPKIIKLYEKLRVENRVNYTKLRKINNSNYEFTIFSFKISEINKSEKLEFKIIINLNKNKIRIIQ
ncbi:MAG: hypothetical protein ACWA42_00325 [Lutibacter sp.]